MHIRRRVLVIAYYFPPMGYSGVQRVARFVKYLPQFGWEPTVLTVEPGGYFAFDTSLLADMVSTRIVRTGSLDPTRLFGRGRTVRMNEGTRGRLSALSQSIFIPDNKIGWYLPAVRRGKQILREGGFRAILSSAPPYTAHLIGARLSRWSGLPLVADFRDDWVGNPRHLYPTPLHRKAHRVLERKVLTGASVVTTINEVMLRSISERAAGSNARVLILPQGYDPEDFASPLQREKTDRMTLHYSGTFYDAQSPDTFLRAVALFFERRPELRERIVLSFAGTFPETSRQLVRALRIEEAVVYHGYLQHREAIARLLEADVVWMTVGRRPGAEGISTGKVFEYMGARKPILALVPEGTLRAVLQGYGASVVVDPDDVSTAATAVEQLFENWQSGTLPVPDEPFVERYDRRRIAGELGRVFDRIVDVSE